MESKTYAWTCRNYRMNFYLTRPYLHYAPVCLYAVCIVICHVAVNTTHFHTSSDSMWFNCKQRHSVCNQFEIFRPLFCVFQCDVTEHLTFTLGHYPVTWPITMSVRMKSNFNHFTISFCVSVTPNELNNDIFKFIRNDKQQTNFGWRAIQRHIQTYLFPLEIDDDFKLIQSLLSLIIYFFALYTSLLHI